MFDEFSTRARHVIFTTRLKAGRRGAVALDTNHLIEAIVLEDQDKLADALGVPPDQLGRRATSESRPTVRFFSAEVATRILERLQTEFPPGTAIPDAVDMPTSDALRRTFDDALKLRMELQHNEVEPSHLLAATLSQDSCQGCAVLRESGIKREDVLSHLKKHF